MGEPASGALPSGRRRSTHSARARCRRPRRSSARSPARWARCPGWVCSCECCRGCRRARRTCASRGSSRTRGSRGRVCDRSDTNHCTRHRRPIAARRAIRPDASQDACRPGLARSGTARLAERRHRKACHRRHRSRAGRSSSRPSPVKGPWCRPRANIPRPGHAFRSGHGRAPVRPQGGRSDRPGWRG